jgi:Peptidase A4 family
MSAHPPIIKALTERHRRSRIPRSGGIRAITTVAVSLAAAVALGLSPAMASARPASASTATSQAWAGYQASRQTFRQVAASWIVPAITCHGTTPAGDPDSYFWAGFGPGSSDSERVGVRELCAGTLTAYVAYLEMNGKYEAQAIDPAAGDNISANVNYVSGKYHFSLTDSTQGKSFSLSYSCGAFSFGQGTCSRSTAEVAAGIWAPGLSPLAEYGKVIFHNAAITDATGRSGSFAGNSHWTITRFSEYQGIKLAAIPSSLSSSGTQFTDTWRHP